MSGQERIRRHRRDGVLLDPEQVRYEAAARGLTPQDLARKAGIHPLTMGAALHGRPVHLRTLRKLALTLQTLPSLVGMELLAKPGTTVVLNSRQRNADRAPNSVGEKEEELSGGTSTENHPIQG